MFLQRIRFRLPQRQDVSVHQVSAESIPTAESNPAAAEPGPAAIVRGSDLDAEAMNTDIKRCVIRGLSDQHCTPDEQLAKRYAREPVADVRGKAAR